MGNNEIIQLMNEIPVTMRTTDTVACRLPIIYKCALGVLACLVPAYSCMLQGPSVLTPARGCPRRDELLTDCKHGTGYSSSTMWCFTVGNNKRRACTAEAGATRPMSWYFAAHTVRRPTPFPPACSPP